MLTNLEQEGVDTEEETSKEQEGNYCVLIISSQQSNSKF
jgi:hypothetical protein